MATNINFEDEDQFISYLKEKYDLSPGRYAIIKLICEYLEMDANTDDSDFEGIKSIFQAYITERISNLSDNGLNGGALTGLRSAELIDTNNQLTVKGFQVIKIVSQYLNRL